jgi:IclR family transcriptional regulator, KDG regulon repressor
MKRRSLNPKRQQVDKNFISVTGKILAVLEFFVLEGSGQQPIAFQKISSSVPFARTTVHRILYSLEKLGYVEKAEAKAHYILGAKFFALTEPAVQYRRLRAVANAVMLELLIRHSETVNLGVLDSGQVVYLDVLQSPSALRIAANPGDRNPVHSTALGKVMIAFLPETEVLSLLDRFPLIRMTSKTITQVSDLFINLALVRQKGVAYDLGENVDGVLCVAAPVFNQNGRVVAGISVSGPASRMESKLPAVSNDVKEAALKLSRLLGPLTAFPQVLPTPYKSAADAIPSAVPAGLNAEPSDNQH